MICQPFNTHIIQSRGYQILHCNSTHSHSIIFLFFRDVYQLQTQVHALQVSEELFARKMDTVKEKVCTFEFLFNALHL